MRLLVVLPLLAVLGALRLTRAGLLAWILSWWIGLYVLFAYGFTTPVPGSAVSLYMGIVSVALVAYVLSSGERIWRVVLR